MTTPLHPATPAERDRAHARLRLLTRGAIVTAAGATVVLGVVVAHDHPGSAAPASTKDTTSSSSDGAAGTSGSSSSGATSGSSDTGTSGDTGASGDTGTTGNTGTPSSSSTPTSTHSSPVVSSGATS